jgi:hypothetical protein
MTVALSGWYGTHFCEKVGPLGILVGTTLGDGVDGNAAGPVCGCDAAGCGTTLLGFFRCASK